MLFLVFYVLIPAVGVCSFVSSRDLSQLHQRGSPRDLLDDLALLHLHGVDDVLGIIHHVVLILVLLQFSVDDPLLLERIFGLLSCLLGCSSRLTSREFANRAVSASQRRHLRVRQSRSASAELTPSSQCEAVVSARS